MEDKSEAHFEPNQEMLQTLMSLGISQEAGEQALFITGNQSAEVAASFLFDNPDFNSCDPRTLVECELKTTKEEEDDKSSQSSEEMDRYKMIFVVNMSLKMGVGKIAAQVGHACLGLYRKMIPNAEQCEMLEKWLYIGEKKIVLKGRDTEHLEELQNIAKDQKVPCFIVHDAGHTQIAPNSLTVLSLFGEEAVINRITGKLNLL